MSNFIHATVFKISVKTVLPVVLDLKLSMKCLHKLVKKKLITTVSFCV